MTTGPVRQLAAAPSPGPSGEGFPENWRCTPGSTLIATTAREVRQARVTGPLGPPAKWVNGAQLRSRPGLAQHLGPL